VIVEIDNSKNNRIKKSGYNTYREWTQIEYQNMHYDFDISVTVHIYISKEDVPT